MGVSVRVHGSKEVEWGDVRGGGANLGGEGWQRGKGQILRTSLHFKNLPLSDLIGEAHTFRTVNPRNYIHHVENLTYSGRTVGLQVPGRGLGCR